MYGLHKGHIQNWDLQLPWLPMGYRFNSQASFSSFSPYFLLFGHEPKLLASIHSYDILGARMLWKPKEAKILKNFIEF
jgi:hypothetical protein